MALMNTAWNALENALVDLADPSYKRIIQKQIKYLRKVVLEKEEITELLKDIDKINMVLHEVSCMQMANNSIIKNGFTTCESKILEAKEEIIQNTNTKLDIKNIRATCHIDREQLDEESAVQFLLEYKQRISSDLCFHIIKAEQKCLLLELKAPSKILKDIETFRMALRALLIQIAHAGKIDINKPSTITMQLIFKDDITEDEVIKEISGQFFHSPRIVASAYYPAVAVPYETRRVNIEDNCKNCENLRTEVIIQQTIIGLLEFKNRDLIFSIIELELLGELQDRKNQS
ncbi:unnamed protein product [Mytilus coruscus]|uniref:Uncharacterized protein n=1 Tax=Mytilus coruscus TaxID=42192 RepID=A0A6J8EXS3_MYTCO|nr:unnamed protein product [Mytilus coruscus]